MAVSPASRSGANDASGAVTIRSLSATMYSDPSPGSQPVLKIGITAVAAEERGVQSTSNAYDKCQSKHNIGSNQLGMAFCSGPVRA